MGETGVVWIQCSCMRFSNKINLGARDRAQPLTALSLRRMAV